MPVKRKSPTKKSRPTKPKVSLRGLKIGTRIPGTRWYVRRAKLSPAERMAGKRKGRKVLRYKPLPKRR